MTSIMAANRGEANFSWPQVAHDGAVPSVGAVEAAAWIQEHQAFVLDVRDPWEYAKGRIQGAISLPQADLAIRLEVENVELEEPKEGEVLVKVAAAGVCHSDLSVINGVIPWPLPAVLGHEGAGVVEAVGTGVNHLKAGDRVIFSFIPACGRCFYCLRARPNLCEPCLRLGGNLNDGTSRLTSAAGEPINHFSATSCFAQYTVVPQQGAIKIDTNAPLDKLALIGCCVTTGVGAVFNTAQVEPGSSVAVFGCGESASA